MKVNGMVFECQMCYVYFLMLIYSKKNSKLLNVKIIFIQICYKHGLWNCSL